MLRVIGTDSEFDAHEVKAHLHTFIIEGALSMRGEPMFYAGSRSKLGP